MVRSTARVEGTAAARAFFCIRQVRIDRKPKATSTAEQGGFFKPGPRPELRFVIRQHIVALAAAIESVAAGES
jgi:hypothetical protein